MEWRAQGRASTLAQIGWNKLPSVSRLAGVQDWQAFRQDVRSLWSSRAGSGATSAASSVLDYLAQPVLMVLAAPFLVGRLGLESYGLWMLMLALAGGLAVFGLGVSDAAVKYIAAYRGRGDLAGVVRVARLCVFGSILLGALPSLVLAGLAPILAYTVFKIPPELQAPGVMAMRIAALLLFIRTLEQVFASILRGCDRYPETARISVLSKCAAVGAAVTLASAGWGVVALMWAGVMTAFFALVLQAHRAKQALPELTFWPAFDRAAWAEIREYGFFTWLQGFAAMLFSYADRLLIGAMLGPAAVGLYSICVHLAQPIHGLVAAALNFVFPRLSTTLAARDSEGARRIFRKAILVGAAATFLLGLPLLLWGKEILAVWMGRGIAVQVTATLPVLVLAFMALSLNVPSHYALLAMGHARYVSSLNIGGAALCLAGSCVLIPQWGLLGAAVGRLLYGPMTLLSVWQAIRRLRP
jgi:O-antigen/teichoic acid export membrane protein